HAQVARHQQLAIGAEQVLDGDVLVDFRPRDPDTTADELVVGALLGAGTDQAWKPGEWHSDLSPVLQVDDQRVITEAHGTRAPAPLRPHGCSRSPFGSPHARPAP